MSKIHNNPKLSEPRMPLILSEDLSNTWLNEESNNEQLKNTFIPHEIKQVKAHSVQKLRGKDASGNTEQASNYVHYEDLV